MRENNQTVSELENDWTPLKARLLLLYHIMKHQCKYKCASKYSPTINLILERFEILQLLDRIMFNKPTRTHNPHRVLPNTSELKNVCYFESTATVELFSPLHLSPEALVFARGEQQPFPLCCWHKVTTRAQCWSRGAWHLRSRFYWSELKFFCVFLFLHVCMAEGFCGHLSGLVE